MCCRCGDVLCATRSWKVCDVCWRLEVVLSALEMLCAAVEGEFSLLEVLEVMEMMRGVLLHIRVAMGGGLCVLELSEVVEVKRRVWFRIMAAVEGGLWSPDAIGRGGADVRFAA